MNKVLKDEKNPNLADVLAFPLIIPAWNEYLLLVKRLDISTGTSDVEKLSCAVYHMSLVPITG
jgi:hypothetical protein